MKKALFIILSFVSIMSISGCGCNKKQENPTNNQDSIKNEDGTLKETVNTNTGVTKIQEVDGITLSEPALVSTAYNSVLTIKAENKTKSDISLNYFKVYFKDKDGKYILTDPNYAVAPVYGTIKSNESMTLIANIDSNLNSVYTIEYEMIK